VANQRPFLGVIGGSGDDFASVLANGLENVQASQTKADNLAVQLADGTLADARKLLRSGAAFAQPRPGENTSIGVVATNASLSKADVNRMALMADDGFARAIVPSHTVGDGDTLFSLATGRWDGSATVSLIGALAADVVAQAVVRAATQATSVAGIPAARDLGR